MQVEFRSHFSEKKNASLWSEKYSKCLTIYNYITIVKYELKMFLSIAVLVSFNIKIFNQILIMFIIYIQTSMCLAAVVH